MSHELTQKLVVIVACYAALAFVGSRRWLRPLEIVIIGVAMIFWAAGWLMRTLVPQVTIPLYGPGWRAVGLGAALTFPVVLAMAVGLRLLTRWMRRNVPRPTAGALPRRRRKRGK